ncbi:anti-sigma factor family protein [Acidobacteriota bacterium]
MKCKESEKLLVINMFGKLTPEEKKQLESHLQDCEMCVLKYDPSFQITGIPEDSEDVPLPDMEESWKVISQRALRPKRGFQLFIPYRKLVWAAPALVLVFVLGFFLGRQVLFNKNSRPGGPLFAESSGTPIERYAEGLETILVGFMNRDPAPRSQDLEGLERLLIEEMLVQTKILKHLFQEKDNPVLELLEDLEFILVALSNLNPDDSFGAEQLHQLIEEGELKLRLQVLSDSKTIL